MTTDHRRHWRLERRADAAGYDGAVTDLYDTQPEAPPMTTDCKYCGARIDWAITIANRRIPLDPDPTTDGNLAARRDHTGRLRARALENGEQPGRHEQRVTSHFATCPNRPKRRRRQ